MGARKGYFDEGGWCRWMGKGSKMPERSVFPDPKDRGVTWIMADIPLTSSRVQSTQGWKLHISSHPSDVTKLLDIVLPILQNERVCHKYFPEEDYKKMPYGRHVSAEDGQGKAVTVYPEDPGKLRDIVIKLEGAVKKKKAAVRPFPGGIRGDLLIGVTGLMYIRYGGFQGPYADKNRVYNPKTDSGEDDPRFEKPFPSFVQIIPRELAGLRHKATGFV